MHKLFNLYSLAASTEAASAVTKNRVFDSAAWWFALEEERKARSSFAQAKAAWLFDQGVNFGPMGWGKEWCHQMGWQSVKTLTETQQAVILLEPRWLHPSR